MLFPIWQPRSLKTLDSRRATRTKYAEATVEGYQKLKVVEEAATAEGEALVGAEAKASGAPMDHSSMEWTNKTSKNASTQARCNRQSLKETPTSPRSAQRPTIKDTVTSTYLGGM